MNAVGPPARGVLAPLAASALALLLGIGALAFFGVDPARGLATFLEGSVLTRNAWAESLTFATPLVFCGLATALSFRAGLFNIGAEGQLLAGMLAATLCATRAEGFAAGVLTSSPVFALVFGAAAGALLALLAAWLRLARFVPEVLSTLLLNFVLLHAVGYAVHGPLQEVAAALPQSDAVLASARLPRVLTGRMHAGIPLALAAAGLIALLVRRSKLGLRIEAAGHAPRAARLAGFPVRRDLALVFALSGALAGLGGAVELLGVNDRLLEKPSPGFGYVAIAVALLGRLRPFGVVCAGVFFGALEAGSVALQLDLGVSASFARALEGGAILLFLAFDSAPIRERARRAFSRAPSARSGPAGGAP